MSIDPSKIKAENISPTEIGVPKESFAAFCEALKEYCGIEDNEFLDQPKREGTQNYMDDSGGIDEWYVDLKDLIVDGERQLNFDDLVWIGRFWFDIEKTMKERLAIAEKRERSKISNMKLTIQGLPLREVVKHDEFWIIETPTATSGGQSVFKGNVEKLKQFVKRHGLSQHGNFSNEYIFKKHPLILEIFKSLNQ